MTSDLTAMAHRFHLGEQELTYYDTENDRGSDNVIVLVHGTGGSTIGHFNWLMPVLANRQRVYSLDMVMPPTVEAGSPLELDHLADQVIALLEKLDLAGSRTVTLLGYSLGSPVVTQVAVRRPELLDRMVHLNGFIATDRHRLLRGRLWRRLYAQGDMEALKEFNFLTAFSSSFMQTQADVVVDRIFANQTFSPFADAQMDLNGRIDLTEQARTLPHPSLIIGSSADFMVPVRSQRLLFGHLQDSRLAVIPGGHACVVERPAQVALLVQDFVDHPDRYPAGSEIPLSAV